MLLLLGYTRVYSPAMGASIAVNLDRVSLDNVNEFQSELCDSQSLFIDSMGMNVKCHKLNRT